MANVVGRRSRQKASTWWCANSYAILCQLKGYTYHIYLLLVGTLNNTWKKFFKTIFILLIERFAAMLLPRIYLLFEQNQRNTFTKVGKTLPSCASSMLLFFFSLSPSLTTFRIEPFSTYFLVVVYRATTRRSYYVSNVRIKSVKLIHVPPTWNKVQKKRAKISHKYTIDISIVLIKKPVKFPRSTPIRLANVTRKPTTYLPYTKPTPI